MHYTAAVARGIPSDERAGKLRTFRIHSKPGTDHIQRFERRHSRIAVSRSTDNDFGGGISGCGSDELQLRFAYHDYSGSTEILPLTLSTTSSTWMVKSLETAEGLR